MFLLSKSEFASVSEAKLTVLKQAIFTNSDVPSYKLLAELIQLIGTSA